MRQQRATDAVDRIHGSVANTRQPPTRLDDTVTTKVIMRRPMRRLNGRRSMAGHWSPMDYSLSGYDRGIIDSRSWLAIDFLAALCRCIDVAQLHSTDVHIGYLLYQFCCLSFGSNWDDTSTDRPRSWAADQWLVGSSRTSREHGVQEANGNHAAYLGGITLLKRTSHGTILTGMLQVSALPNRHLICSADKIHINDCHWFFRQTGFCSDGNLLGARAPRGMAYKRQTVTMRHTWEASRC